MRSQVSVFQVKNDRLHLGLCRTSAVSVDTENTRGKWQFLLFRYCLLSGNHPHLQLVRSAL